MPPSDIPVPALITCPSCGYHAGQAAAAHLLYNEELLRADYESQRANQAVDELIAARRELAELRERCEIAERRAERAMAERDAWVDRNAA